MLAGISTVQAVDLGIYRSTDKGESWALIPSTSPLTAVQKIAVSSSHINTSTLTGLNADIDAGDHNVQLNAGNLANGVYFYRLQAGCYTGTRKLILMLHQFPVPL